MLDFFKGKIYHKPDDIIPSECRQYLGDYEGGQVALAFEDGEFRIYTYEWCDDDEYEEEGRGFLGYIFENFTGSFNTNYIGYVPIESNDMEEILDIIKDSCDIQIEYFSEYSRDELPKFIKRRLPKAKKYVKVYSYYK